MRISDLQRMLAEVKAQHGDIPVLCGERPFGALVVLPPSSSWPTKTASFVLRDRRYKPRS